MSLLHGSRCACCLASCSAATRPVVCDCVCVLFWTPFSCRSYVLSHIKDLTYLDYRRVNQADVQAAMEQHQVRWRCLICVIFCQCGCAGWLFGGFILVVKGCSASGS